MTTENIDKGWTEMKGKIKTKWNKFSDTDIDGFKDKMHLISEKVQKVYSISKEKAEDEYKDFKKSYDIK